MAGVLDYSSGINQAVGGLGEIDDTGNTFVGTINGRFKVYIDLTQQTYLLTNTTLLDTKVLTHTTQDYSTAHTFHYKCTERLVRIHSTHVSGLKLVTEWFLTHSLRDLQHLQTLIHSIVQTLVLTLTTEELELLTLCNPVSGYTEITLQGAFRPFFYAKL